MSTLGGSSSISSNGSTPPSLTRRLSLLPFVRSAASADSATSSPNNSPRKPSLASRVWRSSSLNSYSNSSNNATSSAMLMTPAMVELEQIIQHGESRNELMNKLLGEDNELDSSTYVRFVAYVLQYEAETDAKARQEKGMGITNTFLCKSAICALPLVLTSDSPRHHMLFATSTSSPHDRIIQCKLAALQELLQNALVSDYLLAHGAHE